MIYLSAKVQALEKLNKTDHRDVQIQTEEFNREPISELYYKNRDEQSKEQSYRNCQMAEALLLLTRLLC